MPANKIYDEQLILRKIAGGDEPAFRELFDEYRGRLFAFVSKFIRSEQVAEELVLDVFMKLWLGRELLVQVRNFDAFLFRVAHNKSIDFLRAAAKDSALRELLWDDIQAAAGERPDMQLQQREFEGKLRRAVELLPPQARKVYQLSRESDMSHDQIATQLQISRSTVNNHIVAAQRFIRSYLSREMDLALLILFLGRV